MIMSTNPLGEFIALVQDLMTIAATRLIALCAANEDLLALVNQSLRAICGIATLHADGEILCDELRDSQKLRHAAKGLPAIVLIQPRDYHPIASICKIVTDADYRFIKELRLIDCDDLYIIF